MADCHLPEVPQGPGVSSTTHKGSQTPTPPEVNDRGAARSMFSPLRETTCRPADTRVEMFPERFNMVYKDLPIVTSRDEHGCTSNRLISIY
jgi:hypothetical protein